MHQTAVAQSSAISSSALASGMPEQTKREFLAFTLGAEEYGVDLLHVQEIRTFERPTHIANAPTHILGVVNLRGVIVPVVDMRIKFNLDKARYDTFTVVIVLNLGSQVVGMVVDGVSDVITLTPSQLRPAPQFDSAVMTDHVSAIGSVGERMLILVDIEKFIYTQEMACFDQPLQ
jgi:purine-binding chemotaxis protein CheW